MIPGSVAAAGVPWPDEVGLPGGLLPGAALWVTLGLAAGVFFGGIVSLSTF